MSDRGASSCESRRQDARNRAKRLVFTAHLSIVGCERRSRGLTKSSVGPRRASMQSCGSLSERRARPRLSPGTRGPIRVENRGAASMRPASSAGRSVVTTVVTFSAASFNEAPLLQRGDRSPSEIFSSQRVSCRSASAPAHHDRLARVQRNPITSTSIVSTISPAASASPESAHTWPLAQPADDRSAPDRTSRFTPKGGGDQRVSNPGYTPVSPVTYRASSRTWTSRTRR